MKILANVADGSMLILSAPEQRQRVADICARRRSKKPGRDQETSTRTAPLRLTGLA
jgi:hypothetical protein